MPTCPTCGGENLRRSRRRSLLGLLQRWRGLRRYRCRDCRRTFYSELSPAEHESSVERIRRGREHRPRIPGPYHRSQLRRRATDLILFLCLIVVFYAALRYLARAP